MTTVDTTAKTGGIQYWHKIVVLLCLGWTVMWIYRPVLTRSEERRVGKECSSR